MENNKFEPLFDDLKEGQTLGDAVSKNELLKELKKKIKSTDDKVFGDVDETANYLKDYLGIHSMILTEDESNLIYLAKINDTYKVFTDVGIKKYIWNKISELELGLTTSKINDIVPLVISKIKRKYKPNAKYSVFLKNGEYKFKGDVGFHRTDETPITYNVIPIDYVEKDKLNPKDIETYNTFMNQFDYKEGLLRSIKEMFAISLLPTGVARKAFFLVGNGANGKSSLVKFFCDTIGNDKVSELTLNDISEQRSFPKYDLIGKIINRIDDMDNIPTNQTGSFKTLVAGEMMRAEIKNGPTLSFKNEATLIAGSNHMPKFKEQGLSTAITDRVRIITLENSFKDREKQFDLTLLESKGVKQVFINDLLTVLKELSEKKFALTLSAEDIINQKQFAVETNNILGWIQDKEMEDILTRDFITSSKIGLYNEYVAWCQASGIRPCSMQRFSPVFFDKVNEYGYQMIEKRVTLAGKRGKARLIIFKHKDSDKPLTIIPTEYSHLNH